MKVVFLVRHGGLVLLLTLLVDQNQTLWQARPPIACQLLQSRQLPVLLGPFGTATHVGETDSNPTQTVLFHDHQARLATKENLIPGSLLDTTATVGIKDRQQRGGADSGSATDTAKSSHTGQTFGSVGLTRQ